MLFLHSNDLDYIIEHVVWFSCVKLILYFSMKKQNFFDIDDSCKDWFLYNAGKKWKEFKAELKRQYFDDKLTDEELKKRHHGRVNDEDWKFLVDYWKSPESEVRLILLHTYVITIGQYLCIM